MDELASARRVNVVASAVFFFQAEDGIRDGTVTGVQTCALPIYAAADALRADRAADDNDGLQTLLTAIRAAAQTPRGATVAVVGDRKSVVYGKSVDVRGRRINKTINANDAYGSRVAQDAKIYGNH